MIEFCYRYINIKINSMSMIFLVPDKLVKPYEAVLAHTVTIVSGGKLLSNLCWQHCLDETRGSALGGFGER